MEGARFTIPTPALLAKVVDMIDKVPMEDRDTKGDLYEYMLGKIASAGQNGQFRTPRHIIRLMVEMVEPKPTDVVCDPACGTCGFLVAVGESLRERHPEVLTNAKLRQHFHHGLFHGFDFDNTMLRIGSMNMLLHGVENPDVVYRDSLSQDHASEDEKYTLVMANPPFAGSLDYESLLIANIMTEKAREIAIGPWMWVRFQENAFGGLRVFICAEADAWQRELPPYIIFIHEEVDGSDPAAIFDEQVDGGLLG
jgi:type I restriction-modification system DNA methylase subunit